jgi:hypothetical protein
MNYRVDNFHPNLTKNFIKVSEIPRTNIVDNNITESKLRIKYYETI